MKEVIIYLLLVTLISFASSSSSSKTRLDGVTERRTLAFCFYICRINSHCPACLGYFISLLLLIQQLRLEFSFQQIANLRVMRKPKISFNYLPHQIIIRLTFCMRNLELLQIFLVFFPTLFLGLVK